MKVNKTTKIITLVMVCFLAACATGESSREKKKKAEAMRKLGEAYMYEDRDAAAFQKLLEAERLDPDDPALHFAFGIFYFKKKKYDLAIERYEKCLALNPQFAPVLNNIGLSYMEKKDYDTAIKYFERLNDNYVYATPHYPLFNKGRCYFYKNDFAKAKENFSSALELSPAFSPALHWLGKTYLKLKKTPEAIKVLEKASILSPSNAELFFDLGSAYTAAGWTDQALWAYQRTIELDPDGDFSHIARSRIK
jgi:type IV pilus assembly protein PilF